MSECGREGEQYVSLATLAAAVERQTVGSGGTIVDALGQTETYEAIRRRFGQQMLPTDVIYYFCSEPSAWDQMMGSEGYLLVREGEIIADVTLRMN